MVRPEGWTIELASSGQCDIYLERRPVAYDRDDLDEALRTIRRDTRWNYQVVTLIHPDGYREVLEVRS